MEDDTPIEQLVEQQYDIELLVRAKTYLDSLPIILQDPDYKNIVELVNEYINTKCIHRIVTDSIDVSCEESRPIRYCELCFTPFILNADPKGRRL